MGTGLEGIREMLDEEGSMIPSDSFDDYRKLGIERTRLLMDVSLDGLSQAKGWSRSSEAVPAELKNQIRDLADKAQVIVDKLKEMR